MFTARNFSIPCVTPSCGLLVSTGTAYVCFPGGEYKQSISTYTYKDPYGREFKLDAATGKLKSLKDLNNNELTFTPNGIKSNAGNSEVKFKRDSSGRITLITDTMGVEYNYEYDANGDLQFVRYPAPQSGGTALTTEYSYYTGHYFKDVKDPRGTVAATTTYYPDGRLASVSAPLNATQLFTTSYGYSLPSGSVPGITTITNTDGGVTSLAYDNYGMVISETMDIATGQTRTTLSEYDAKHKLSKTTLPNPDTGLPDASRTVTYTYDIRGFQTEVKDPLGNINKVDYDQYGNPTKFTNAFGITQTISYNQDFMPSAMQDKEGSMGISFNPQGKVGKVFIGNDPTKASTYDYDQYGNIKKQTVVVTGSVTYVTNYDLYDNMGRLKQVSMPVDANTTAVTLNEYDDLGRTKKTSMTVDGIVYSTEYEYDGNGNVTAQVAKPPSSGWRTEFTYDRANQLILIKNPDNTTLEYTYDWRGNKVTEKNERGFTTVYTYDLVGQLVKVEKPDGTVSNPLTSTIRIEYDAAGRKIKEYDALDHLTQYVYDADDKLVKVIEPTGDTNHAIIYHYDAAGRKDYVIDANNIKTCSIFDDRNRLKEVISACETSEAKSQKYFYDEMGNLRETRDFAGKITTFTYDYIGRLTSVTKPLTSSISQTINYAYDRFGNLTLIRDAKGHETKLEYDVMSRLKKKTWQDQTFESYTYDFFTQGADTYGRSCQTLPDTGLPSNLTNCQLYNARGWMVKANFFDGRIVNYSYTPNGQPESITDSVVGVNPVTYT